MFKEIIDGQNPKRRIVSMLGKNFSRIKYILFLALLLAAPIKSWAGIVPLAPGFFGTDGLSMQLYSFWDLRGRDSFVQVTNTGPNKIRVHVQIFNARIGCVDRDFDDIYTPGDTHVYNLRGLTANDPLENPLNIAFSEGDFGLVVVTNVDIVTGVALGGIGDFVLNGNFRVIDNSGFEYRSNTDSFVSATLFGILDETNDINFNDAGGAAFSDIVGVFLTHAGPGFDTVLAQGGAFTLGSPSVKADQNFIIDTQENGTSCGTFTFACNPTNFDVGINTRLPNSEVGTQICSGNIDPVGFVDFGSLSINTLPSGTTVTTPVTTLAFVGFAGLNNGGSFGSMDTWRTGFPGTIIPNSETDTQN